MEAIICAGTIIAVYVRIGRHEFVNLAYTVEDDVIHDYITFYLNVNISGNVEVEECSELGTGMQIIQEKNIGKESIIAQEQ